jgi:hypothetical protein
MIGRPLTDAERSAVTVEHGPDGQMSGTRVGQPLAGLLERRQAELLAELRSRRPAPVGASAPSADGRPSDGSVPLPGTRRSQPGPAPAPSR